MVSRGTRAGAAGYSRRKPNFWAQNAGRNTNAELFSCPDEGTKKERVMTHARPHASPGMTSALGYTDWTREYARRSNEKTLSQQIFVGIIRLWNSHRRTLMEGIAYSRRLLPTTACEGGLIPAHLYSIVRQEGYWTSFMSRRTRSWISAVLRYQKLTSAPRVGWRPATTLSPHANTVQSGA